MAAPTPFMEYVGDRLSKYDHILHVLLASMLCGAVCLDWQRKHKWKNLTVKQLAVCMLVGFLISATFEVLQLFTPEEYRRWFDVYDLFWQAVGAVLMTMIYAVIQHKWTETATAPRGGRGRGH